MPRLAHIRSLLLFFGFSTAVSVVAADPAVSAEAGAAFDWRAFLAPFHTVTLHLPIGFVTIAVILELYSFFRPSEPLRSALTLILWVSGISAVIVAMLGIFRAAGGGYEETMLRHHEQFGIAVAVVTVLIALVHSIAFRKGKRPRGMAALYRLMLLGDMVLLTIAGHGGGNLTHGSKYLVEGAPPWVKEWVEKRQEADAAGPGGGGKAPGGSSEGSVFADQIRPIFEKKCFSCHGSEKQKGEYRMDTAEGLFQAGESEIDPIVVGKPMESYLIELLTLPDDDEFAMPPEGKDRLTAEETLAVMRWIWDGAKVE